LTVRVLNVGDVLCEESLTESIARMTLQENFPPITAAIENGFDLPTLEIPYILPIKTYRLHRSSTENSKVRLSLSQRSDTMTDHDPSPQGTDLARFALSTTSGHRLLEVRTALKPRYLLRQTGRQPGSSGRQRFGEC
jgi:hypothetical protein